MKIFLFIPMLSGAGGAEKILTRMANYWSRKFEVVVVTLDKPWNALFYKMDPVVQYIPLNSLEVSENVFQQIFFTAKRLIMFRKVVLNHKPDVIISFLSLANFISIIATRFLKIPVIISERSNPHLNVTNIKREKINSRLYSLANSLVVQTNEICQIYPDRIKNKLEVIPNSVLSPPKMSNDLSNKAILSVGRLGPEKGYDILLRSFAKIHGRFPDWNLNIVGDGLLMDYLVQLADELTISDKVKFLGSVTNPESIISDCSIYVLSSRYEGFPNALCEAMAHGRAVIATSCPFGPSEIIEDNRNGMLVPVENVEALSNAMLKLMENKKLRIEIGNNARSITTKYSLTNVMNQWESLINRLVQKYN